MSLSKFSRIPWPRLTQGKFLAGVRRQREAQDGHGGDQHAGNDQIEEVIERSTSDLDDEGHVQVGLRAAVVEDLVAFARNAYN